MKAPSSKLQIPEKPQASNTKWRAILRAPNPILEVLALGIWSFFGVWCLVFGASTFAADSDDPAAELASFQIADGFEVNLFASEKDGVVKPIQMRFDARGRLWVIGSTVYPQIEPGQVPNDKVLILEDTDGDGRCDKTTIFADGLMIPTGLEIGDGGAYVGHGTELLFLKDMDGDGKADERRVVLRGFGTGDNHQNINSFRWGPGGELWMSQGLHTRSNVETPWGVVRLNQAGIWRLWPHRLKLEGFYGSEHEPQNPWGFIFTDWGEPIVLAGNNSSPIYAVPGLVSNHRDLAPVLIWKNGNGRKVSNGDVVGTTHFPDSWQGALIVGGYINNAVWALRISDDGSGFMLEDLPPLIRSSSRSFRPVDAKFGPDGALYLCDWYNPIIGHYQASFRHPDRDKTHGRIWRVTAKGRPLTKPPQLADASIEELLNSLKSPDRWTRYYAKRALADRPTDEVTVALKQWIARPGLSEQVMVEALGIYQSHEVIAPELLARLCRANETGARAYAAGLVGTWADRLSDPLTLLRPLVADENPRVRLQAVVACTYVPKSEAMEIAAIAADYPTDKFLSYALNQAVYALKPYWRSVFTTNQLGLSAYPKRLELIIKADGTSDTLQVLRQMLASNSLNSETREAFFKILADTGQPEDLATLLDPETFASAGRNDDNQHARVLAALETASRVRKLRPAGDLATALKPLLETPHSRAVQVAALRLVGLWGISELRVDAQRALATGSDLDASITAAKTIAELEGQDSLGAFYNLTKEDKPTNTRIAGAIALASLNLQRGSQTAAEILASEINEPATTALVLALATRAGGTEALASALEAKPPARDNARLALRLINSSGQQATNLVAVLTKAAGFVAEPLRPTPDFVARLSGEIRAHGDAVHGREVFHRAELACVNCHRIAGEGGTIGPELSTLGTAQPVDFIIGAILDPQKEIKEGYTSIAITTKDGEEYQGYALRETNEEFVLRDILQNREVRVRRDMIREKKQNGSVMPSGLADTLTRAEFRDLVKFLSELGKVK